MAEGYTTDTATASANGTGSGNSVSLDEVQAVPNPLSKFQSFNSLFTLAAMSKADQNFGVADKSKFTNIICRSQGDWAQDRANTRVQTAFGTYDYFIDDVTIVSIPAQSPETGNSFATKISFKVYEPYSMGLFMLALQQGAAQAGYGMNFTEASYMFMIEWIGYVNSKPSAEPGADLTRYIPIKIINITFKVGLTGSVYDCEAIPYNEHAFRDQAVKVPTDVKISGDKVVDILALGPTSLTTQLYDRAQNEKDHIKNPDTVLIQFPNDYMSPPGYDSEIAKSKIYTDLNAGGSIPFPDFQDVHIGDNKDIYSSKFLKIEGKRVWQFTQEVTIPQIITEVILRSEYITNQITGSRIKPDENGMVKWFRIETQILDDEDDPQLGRQRRYLIYKVIPYKVHIHKLLPPGQKPPGYDNLAKQVIRVYDYMYTGKNTEVLNVDINFDMAYFTPLPADNSERVGQAIANFGGITAGGLDVMYRPPPTATMSQTAQSLGIGQTPDQNILNQFAGNLYGSGALTTSSTQNFLTTGSTATSQNTISVEPIANATQVAQREFLTKAPGGAASDDGRMQQVRIMQTLLTNEADMLQLNMEIMGDPYYIPTSGFGSQKVPRKSMNELEDGSMNYQESEVDIIVRFRTPVDLDPYTGLYRFEKGIDIWSGLYQLTEVESRFLQGKFTQKIRANRLRTQLGGSEFQKPFMEETGRTAKSNNSATGGGQGGDGGGQGGSGGDGGGGGAPVAPDITSPTNPPTNFGAGAAAAGIPQQAAPSIYNAFGQNFTGR